MAYATADDVAEAAGRALTTEETAQVDGWLLDAALLIAGYLGDRVERADPDALERVSVNMAVRALTSSVPAGASSGSVTAGPFATAVQYVPGASAGGVWLSASDRTMLSRWRAGAMSVQLGSERYREPC